MGGDRGGTGRLVRLTICRACIQQRLERGDRTAPCSGFVAGRQATGSMGSVVRIKMKTGEQNRPAGYLPRGRFLIRGSRGSGSRTRQDSVFCFPAMKWFSGYIPMGCPMCCRCTMTLRYCFNTDAGNFRELKFGAVAACFFCTVKRFVSSGYERIRTAGSEARAYCHAQARRHGNFS